MHRLERAGQILDTLKNLKLDNNTYVVFTSDNGPWLSHGKSAGKAGPLREGKGTTYEGGMREPCIFWAPGRIPAGKTCSELTSTMDFYSTFAALAGTALPTDRVIDGKDIRPLLAATAGAKTPYDAFYYYNVGGKIEAVQAGDWKFRIYNSDRTVAVPAGTALKQGDSELYNLKDDIGEKTNVADKHPDIVARLKSMMERFDADLTKHSRPVGRAGGR